MFDANRVIFGTIFNQTGQEVDLILFYDGSDASILEQAEGLESRGLRRVDLRSGELEPALAHAGEPWLSLLASGVEALMDEAGKGKNW